MTHRDFYTKILALTSVFLFLILFLSTASAVAAHSASSAGTAVPPGNFEVKVGDITKEITLRPEGTEKPSLVLPVANFSSDITKGYAPLTVQFTDLSENATSVSWNFGDKKTSTERNPVHKFTTAGTYIVNLTAINGNGTDSKSAIINVTKKPIQWEFFPQEPVSGDILNINGNASQGEKVDVLATFEKTVPVSGGKFEYNLKDVKIPEGYNNLFTVEAKGAKNLNVRVKMVLWVTRSSNASGDTATVSQSNVPSGTYKIKIDGNAGEGVSEVNLKITAFEKIKADSNGNFSYSYNTTVVPPGDFEVKIGDITKEITLRPEVTERPSVVLPVANFSSDVTKGYAPLTVQFTDLSENATSVNWDFGDKKNSTERNPVHKFTTQGTYTVNLTAINGNGTDSKSTTIEVTKKPTHWEFFPQEPISGDILNIDGSTSPGEKVGASVTFEKIVPVSKGKFEYNLKDVKIPEGYNNLFTVEAKGAKNLNVRVKMVLWVTKSSEASGDTAVVSQSNVPPGTYKIKIDGDAGEGVSEVNLKITAFQKIKADSNGNFSYSYNTTAVPPGDFEVKVGDITKEITLRPEEPPLVLPFANFSSDVTEGYAPLTVQFTDLSENATSVNWDFGDKKTSTERNPVHKFTTAGTYSVNLTAINGNGTGSKSAIINVTKKPIHWEFFPQEPISGDILNIGGSASPGEKIGAFVTYEKAVHVSGGKFEYNLKDVKIPEGFNNIFTVEAKGAKNLNVRVKMVLWVTKSSNASGDTASVSQSNVPPGTYKIKIDGDAGEGVSEVNLKITAFQKIKADSNGNFSYSYNTTAVPPGSFEVKVGDITKEITIKPEGTGEPLLVLPVANFSSDVTEGYIPLSVQFTDLSKNVISWNWDFGDGSNSTEQNPIHTYGTAGNYTVNLTAANQNSTDSKSAIITVLQSLLPVSGKQFAYITNTKDNSVSIIDTTTNTVISNVTVGTNPQGVAVTPDGKKVYVTNFNSNTVSVIDAATNTVTATVPVGDRPRGVVVSPDGTKAYVVMAGVSSTISVIDTATNTVSSTVKVGAYSEGVAVSPDGTKLYVTNQGSNDVSVIDTATNTVTATVKVGNQPYYVAVAPDGKKVYVTRYLNFVSVIDTATNTITATVKVGDYPRGVVVSPDGTKAYVATSGANGIVYVIDIATNTVTATVTVGTNPQGVAVTPDGKQVYVANFKSNTVSVIDTATNTVTATVLVENNPQKIAVSLGIEPVLPVANFSTNVTSGSTPLSVQFTDLSENVTSVNWDFGDKKTSTERNPVHKFTTQGTYTVNLTAINGNGTDSKSAIINVTKKPIHWAISPQEPVSGDILNIDGSTSPGEKVDVLATFEKTVRVSGGKFEYNLKDAEIPEGFNNLFTVEAKGAKKLNVRVKMFLWITKSSEASGDTAVVSQSNVPPGTYKIKIDGDAGEGVSEVNLKIIAIQKIKADSNGNFSCFYNTTAVPPGNFEVKVGDIKKEITLRPEEPPLVLPHANFSSDVTEGYAPLTVQFTDLSENATSVNWDFDNNGDIDSTASAPVYEFTDPGTYTVNLTATNENGTNSKLATINVTDKPVPVLPFANFISDVTAGYAPLTVQFTDLSENATSVNWDFGDKKTSTERNPVHKFTTAGTYTVNLTAINGNGIDSKSATIEVTKKAIPGHTKLPTDPDHDGRYEDLNGNGRMDFNDVVVLYNNMQWIKENVHFALFDYNNNGRIDFNDIIKLYARI